VGKFQKGDPKRGGRKKGTPNKATVGVKAALLQAFDQMGGVKFLVEWGKEHPSEFFALWGKLIPQEVRNPDGESFRVEMVEEIVDAAP
jgi:hypothetical protein